MWLGYKKMGMDVSDIPQACQVVNFKQADLISINIMWRARLTLP